MSAQAVGRRGRRVAVSPHLTRERVRLKDLLQYRYLTPRKILSGSRLLPIGGGVFSAGCGGGGGIALNLLRVLVAPRDLALARRCERAEGAHSSERAHHGGPFRSNGESCLTEPASSYP